jgi:dTDP-glucose 4,6-dehydratase
MEYLNKDLQHIVNKTRTILPQFKDKTIFITGGTGFFGIWLLMGLVHANQELGLNIRIIVLSRNKDKFLAKYPFINSYKEISFIQGDISNFTFPISKIDYIVHAATEASVKLNIEAPMEMFETIVSGTKRVLELASIKKVKSFLITSSGAVYGKQPSNITNMEEDYPGAPPTLDPSSMYGEGKRMAELLCAVYHKKNDVPVKIARCYAFVGPYLPIDTHFAVGNFIRDILTDRNINIQGDGTPYRSYMYASDLVIWLLTILLTGKDNYAYNVGSDHSISIEELAHEVNKFNPKSKVNIMQLKSTSPPLRYVPSINRAKKELMLDISIDLSTAIEKTIDFYRNINYLN